MNVILCCNCGSTPKFSLDAIQMIKKGEPIPAIYSGQGGIRRFAEGLSDGNMKTYAMALSKSRGKFTYYFEYDEKGDVIEQYNLKTGAKVV